MNVYTVTTLFDSIKIKSGHLMASEYTLWVLQLVEMFLGKFRCGISMFLNFLARVSINITIISKCESARRKVCNAPELPKVIY